MKRVDALRILLGGYKEGCIEDVGIRLSDSGCAYNANEMIKLYNYLDEDLCEPKAEQQKPKEKLDERKADKPIPEKVIAGSGKREKIDMGKLIALAKAGRTREWIADEMGVSVATVYNYLKKAKEEGML